MAVYNEILAGRFNRFVQKLLSIKGPVSLVAASPDLAFQHPIFHGAENRYLEGWALFGRHASQASPGVGNTLNIELRNPAGSGIIAVVTRAMFAELLATNTAATNSGLALFRNATADQNTLNSGFGWDLRDRPASTCNMSFNTAAATPIGGTSQNLFLGSVGAQVTVDMIPPGQEIVLTPGTALSMQAGNTNDSATGGYWWRERPLEDSEKF